MGSSTSKSDILVLLRYTSEPRLLGHRNKFAPIGFDVHRVNPGSSQSGPSVAMSPLVAARQICEIFSLDEGDHTFVIDAKQFRTSSATDFVLEIHSRQATTN